MITAGARKTAVVRIRPSLPGSDEGGGAATTGGSAVIPPALKRPVLLALLVGRGRGCLQLLLDARDVLRVPEELLEQPPLALPCRAAERRRLLVRHVEHDGLRGSDQGLASAGYRVGVSTAP